MQITLPANVVNNYCCRHSKRLMAIIKRLASQMSPLALYNANRIGVFAAQTVRECNARENLRQTYSHIRAYTHTHTCRSHVLSDQTHTRELSSALSHTHSMSWLHRTTNECVLFGFFLVLYFVTFSTAGLCVSVQMGECIHTTYTHTHTWASSVDERTKCAAFFAAHNPV